MTIFEKIIAREIPAQIVYEDDTCVAFMDVNPVQRGHLLVVPRQAIDQFDELDDATTAHIFTVASHISKRLREAFNTPRCALLVAGYGVPHAHIHVFPTRSEADIRPEPTLKLSDEELAADAQKVRDALGR